MKLLWFIMTFFHGTHTVHTSGKAHFAFQLSMVYWVQIFNLAFHLFYFYCYFLFGEFLVSVIFSFFYSSRIILELCLHRFRGRGQSICIRWSKGHILFWILKAFENHGSHPAGWILICCIQHFELPRILWKETLSPTRILIQDF